MNKITVLKKISVVVAVFMLSTASVFAQCLPPAAVTISGETQISALVTWTAEVSAEGGYEIEIRTEGVGGDGATGLVSTYVEPSESATTYMATNLAPFTTYTAYVKSRCGGGSSSAYTSSISFQTLSLVSPVALDATEITSESFLAQWTASVGATEYQVKYAEDIDFLNNVYIVSAGANTLKTIFGLDPLTTYFYAVRARSGSGPWTDYSNAIEVQTTDFEPSVATWNGQFWDAQPTSTKDVVIAGDFNTAINEFGHGLNTKDLTVLAPYSFTIATGTFIQVSGSVVNNSTATKFVVESNANLNQQSTSSNTGDITVKRNSFNIFRLDYTMWSSPVENQNLLGFSPQTNITRFYSYNSATDLFATISNPADSVFAAAKGYLIRAPNTWPAYNVESPVAGTKFQGTFVGKPHNGPYTVALQPGYNMVGNPYPTDIAAPSLTNANAAVIDKAIWFWRRRNNEAQGPTTSYYAVWTGLGATTTSITDNGVVVPNTKPNGFIKVGQGFMVKSKTAVESPVITFNRFIKKDQNFTDIFFKTQEEEVEKHVFYLNMTGDAGIFSQVLLGYAADATDEVDDNDAEYIGDSPIALSSLIGDKSYTIQGKALPFDATQNFNLRFETSVAATYNIALEDVTGMFEQNIDPILLDTQTNTQTNLRNASYTFAAEPGVFDTRFKVIFEETALSTVDNTLNANSIVAINNNNVLNISAGSYTINSVEVYDLQGRRIYTTQNVDASTTTISNLNAQQQIILVKIATDHGTVTKKVQF